MGNLNGLTYPEPWYVSLYEFLSQPLAVLSLLFLLTLIVALMIGYVTSRKDLP